MTHHGFIALEIRFAAPPDPNKTGAALAKIAITAPKILPHPFDAVWIPGVVCA
jgi:hypothetical protein